MTRAAILDRASGLASTVGLGGLTIGTLADDLHLSKSGLFGHFRSKEALQIQVLEHAAARFLEVVVRPALREPRGEPRLRRLFDLWMEWVHSGSMPGGCIFVAASTELDDRPGSVRDRLAKLQGDWRETLSISARKAVEADHFRADTDCEQFAHELIGIFLAHHHSARLLRDPLAQQRSRRAFERLLASVRAGGPDQRQP